MDETQMWGALGTVIGGVIVYLVKHYLHGNEIKSILDFLDKSPVSNKELINFSKEYIGESGAKFMSSVTKITKGLQSQDQTPK